MILRQAKSSVDSLFVEKGGPESATGEVVQFGFLFVERGGPEGDGGLPDEEMISKSC